MSLPKGPRSRISTGLAQLPAQSEGKGWGRAATPEVQTEAGLPWEWKLNFTQLYKTRRRHMTPTLTFARNEQDAAERQEKHLYRSVRHHCFAIRGASMTSSKVR